MARCVVLVLTHAVAIGAIVFIVLGGIQLVATTIVLIYTAKYEHSYCPTHLPAPAEPGPEPGRIARGTHSLSPTNGFH